MRHRLEMHECDGLSSFNIFQPTAIKFVHRQSNLYHHHLRCRSPPLGPLSWHPVCQTGRKCLRAENLASEKFHPRQFGQNNCLDLVRGHEFPIFHLIPLGYIYGATEETAKSEEKYVGINRTTLVTILSSEDSVAGHNSFIDRRSPVYLATELGILKI
jgi:hypothetical protein